MSKSIRSYPNVVRPQVVARRIARKTMGLGYWAAIDAEKIAKKKGGAL